MNMAAGEQQQRSPNPSSAAAALSVDAKASLMTQYYQTTARPPSAVDAARSGDCATLAAIVQEHKEAAGASEPDGTCPLVVAAKNGYQECVDLLLRAGADTEAQTRQGTTALMAAAVAGYATCVQLLLKAGAKREARNGRGESALDLAVRSRRPDMVELLGGAEAVAEHCGHASLAFLAQQRAAASMPADVRALLKGLGLRSEAPVLLRAAAWCETHEPAGLDEISIDERYVDSFVRWLGLATFPERRLREQLMPSKDEEEEENGAASAEGEERVASEDGAAEEP